MQKDVSPWAVSGLYLLALIIAVSPLLELMATVWPMRPGELLWRYGALGLFAGYMPNVALGLALVMVLAHWRRHTTILRVVGVTSVTLAVVILLVMGMFALDIGQVRALRADELRGATLVAGMLQEVKYLAGAVALACLGVGAVATSAMITVDKDRPSPAVLRAGTGR